MLGRVLPRVTSALRLPAKVLRLFEGFWIVPLALAALGAGLAGLIGPAGAMLELDSEMAAGEWVDPEGARAALSAVAGGVMTVAGIVFSLTFVALSITAQQLSPRILDYVLRERVTQYLIGLAIASFLFSTIALAVSAEEPGWRLGLAVPIAILLAIATLATVVVFAHAMTRVMRTEEMVARLGHAFVRAVRGMLEPPAGTVGLRLPEGTRAVLERELADAQIVRAGEAGYVARIDVAALVALAEDRDLVIRVVVRENDHLLPGMPVAHVLGVHDDPDEVAAAICRLIEMADRRAPSDGADYEASSLSEAALRALSPGINDPATAISCLNKLAEGIALIATRGAPHEVLGGAARVARVLLPPRRPGDYLEAAVLPVAVAGQGDYRIRRRLARHLGHLAEIAADEADRQAITAFAMRVEAREDPAFST